MRSVFKRNRLIVGPLALILGLSLAGAPPAQAEPQDDPFYQPPSPLPAGAPGDIIRAEPTSIPLVPTADAWRIMYLSTSATDRPMAVTGTVFVPLTPYLFGPRPLVTVTMGTHGMADRCAPSYKMAQGTDAELLEVNGLVLLGYAVVVTDYEQLGTPGDHTYINRKAQGHAALDAARAAQRLGVPGLPGNGPVGIYGYSQGGAGSSAAAELEATYSPELDVRGTATGGVPADIAEVARFSDGQLYSGYVHYAAIGLAEAYDIPLEQELNEFGHQRVAELRNSCTEDVLLRYSFTSIEQLTGRPLEHFLAQEPWATVVPEQRLGPVAPAAPVFLYHALLDNGIPYEVATTLNADWCARGANVTFATIHAAEHIVGAVEGAPLAFAFLQARFMDIPAPSTC